MARTTSTSVWQSLFNEDLKPGGRWDNLNPNAFWAYHHLSIYADNDGIISGVRNSGMKKKDIRRMINLPTRAADKAFYELIASNLVVVNSDGIIRLIKYKDDNNSRKREYRRTFEDNILSDDNEDERAVRSLMASGKNREEAIALVKELSEKRLTGQKRKKVSKDVKTSDTKQQAGLL